jgi:hypothetical protein
MKTARWTFRQAPWFGDGTGLGWTKIHAFELFDAPYVSGKEATLCGRYFSTCTDRDFMRTQARADPSLDWHPHQCDIEIDLEAVECKHCRRALERLR